MFTQAVSKQQRYSTEGYNKELQIKNVKKTFKDKQNGTTVSIL